MKILCVFGKHNYGDPARGEGYEYSNFIPALKRLGHEVIFFESFDRRPYKDFYELNQQLWETVWKEKPEVLLCVLLGYEVWTDTLGLIRENTETVLVNWATDDSWKYEQFSRFVSPYFHIYATTSKDALQKSLSDGHSNFVLTQWGANAENLAVPVPASSCRYQVTFIGTAYGNRIKWIRGLMDRGIEVTCFGHGWERGAIPSGEIPKIIRESFISLNFGDSGIHFRGMLPYRSRQIKARVFEVPGAGGFLMTEWAPDLEEYFVPDEEIITFRTIDDLAERIEYFQLHREERDEIAFKGHERVKEDHTYDRRFYRLLDMAAPIGAMKREKKKMAGNPEEGKNTLEQFERLAKQHEIGHGMRFLRTLLVCPCVALWGRKRGPRAARRFLYELSWRIAGPKTYRASGIPGRLFYKES